MLTPTKRLIPEPRVFSAQDCELASQDGIVGDDSLQGESQEAQAIYESLVLLSQSF